MIKDEIKDINEQAEKIREIIEEPEDFTPNYTLCMFCKKDDTDACVINFTDKNTCVNFVQKDGNFNKRNG
jgi:hypothetical protein